MREEKEKMSKTVSIEHVDKSEWSEGITKENKQILLSMRFSDSGRMLQIAHNARYHTQCKISHTKQLLMWISTE